MKRIIKNKKIKNYNQNKKIKYLKVFNLPYLVIKKTNNNYFLTLSKNNYTIFSVTFFSFIKKNKKDAYRLFWARFKKFMEYRVLKFKIKKLNLIIYGKLMYQYRKFFKISIDFIRKIYLFYFYSGLAHNGCKLKKKKRK